MAQIISISYLNAAGQTSLQLLAFFTPMIFVPMRLSSKEQKILQKKISPTRLSVGFKPI
jgi:hypothetical protein